MGPYRPSAGFAIGLAIKLFVTRRYKHGRADKKVPEVVLIISCQERLVKSTRDILWAHGALGVRKLDLDSPGATAAPNGMIPEGDG